MNQESKFVATLASNYGMRGSTRDEICFSASVFLFYPICLFFGQFDYHLNSSLNCNLPQIPNQLGLAEVVDWVVYDHMFSSFIVDICAARNVF